MSRVGVVLRIVKHLERYEERRGSRNVNEKEYGPCLKEDHNRVN